MEGMKRPFLTMVDVAEKMMLSVIELNNKLLPKF